jgi:hypothetical protein
MNLGRIFGLKIRQLVLEKNSKTVSVPFTAMLETRVARLNATFTIKSEI